MNPDEMKNIWSNYMDLNFRLNSELLGRLNFLKEKSKLNRHILFLFIESIIHFMVLNFLAGYIWDNISELKFAIPAIVLGFFAAASLTASISQIIAVLRLNYEDPIAVLQKKLININMHLIQFARIGLASFPFYLCYAILGFNLMGLDIYSLFNTDWWIANIAFSLVMLSVVIWMLKRINHKNINVKWVRKTVEFFGGKHIVDEMGFLNELDEFEKEK